MNKNTFLKIVNPILACVLLFQVTTGMMHGIFPHELFETIHGSGGGALTLCVIIHVILNWGWVKTNFLKKN